MKYVVLPEAYKIEYHDMEIPEIKPNEVLLKPIYGGICGGDMQAYHGQHKYVKFPITQGHEAACVVEKIGSEVEGYSVGDRVTVEPQATCGECYPCRIGRFNVCEHLKVDSRLFAEHVAVDCKMLHLCPKDMPFEKIVLTEPMAVGIGSVKRCRYKEAKIAVVGAGTIGNLIAQSAKALGAKDVIVADVFEHKLDYALKCGIPHAVNLKEKSLKEWIKEIYGPDGADVIIDAAANQSAFDAILDASRPCSEIVITGNYKVDVRFDVPRIQRREVTIIGHMMYVREDFEDAIRMLNNSEVNVEGFISGRYPLTQYHEAMKFIDANPDKVMKVILEINDPC